MKFFNRWRSKPDITFYGDIVAEVLMNQHTTTLHIESRIAERRLLLLTVLANI